MGYVSPKQKGVKRIWIQAVSVGEVLAIKPMLERLADSSDIEVVLTTTTSTAFRLLRNDFRDLCCWMGIFPMDFLPATLKAWSALQPDLVVLMEGEIWPEHIQQARRRNVPVLLLNGRLSDKSYRRHYRFQRCVRPFTRHLGCILAGSESDWERFRSLGWIEENRIIMAGNLKLDVSLSETSSFLDARKELEASGFLSKGIGESGNILWLAASTWPGEEVMVMTVFHKLRREFPGLRLLIVPRHAERRDAIREAFAKSGWDVPFRSECLNNRPIHNHAYVADTTGELKGFTAIADIVFIGKSLPPNDGGQTPIEAAAFGKPLLFGPNMSNFRDISRQLCIAGGARIVHDETDLESALRELCQDPACRTNAGELARETIAANQGATQRAVDTIREILRSSS